MNSVTWNSPFYMGSGTWVLRFIKMTRGIWFIIYSHPNHRQDLVVTILHHGNFRTQQPRIPEISYRFQLLTWTYRRLTGKVRSQPRWTSSIAGSWTGESAWQFVVKAVAEDVRIQDDLDDSGRWQFSVSAFWMTAGPLFLLGAHIPPLGFFRWSCEALNWYSQVG